MLDVFEEVFIIVCLCLLQVVPVTVFGLPSFSFLHLNRQDTHFFSRLDKNAFSKHKKTRSLKSENHQAISFQSRPNQV